MKTEYKMKKGDFEQYLYDKYGALGYRKHKEHTNGDDTRQYINLTLYYSDNAHIGTWVQGGRCFELAEGGE